jgi:HSP20 family protein
MRLAPGPLPSRCRPSCLLAFLQIDGNVVTISAETKKDAEEKDNGRVLRSEREYGYASRSFTLANAVDEDKADAKYNNGVLELMLPKKAAASSKRLAVG